MNKVLLQDDRSPDRKIESFLAKFSDKVSIYPPGSCPATVQLAMLQASMSQTCGKCVPCRDGLRQVKDLLRRILNGQATMETLAELTRLADMIRNSADCAIGYQAATEVLQGLEAFHDEYVGYIETGKCVGTGEQQIPCVTLCPAHVDIPGYIAHAADGNYDKAVNLIRRDNPLPTACAMICEHPCEERCRRTLIDAPINIRGIKKYIVDQVAADKVAVPEANTLTGKKVAIVGGGPCGMTAAYYLSLMGHKVTVFEAKERLGGMLMYGIPEYRFPKERMDEDFRAILSTGNIEVKYNTSIGTDVSVESLRADYDAMLVAIGAQAGKKLKMDGVDAKGVYSAVEMLDEIGHGKKPDYTGKVVSVIGGGNVAMDAARSALRCGASMVHIIYRRRQDDMTALKSEVEAAVAEGIELHVLQAPLRVETNENNECAAIWVKPQMAGKYRDGRPSPVDAPSKPDVRIACDVLLIAVGQDIISEPFEKAGLPAKWNIFEAELDTSVKSMPGVFVAGDCATGPATAIRAVAGGKVAAYAIDEYLGYHHTLPYREDEPTLRPNNRVPTGRANVQERFAFERKHDFEYVECPFTPEEAAQECGRCLRCDKYGCGVLESAEK